MMVGESQGTEEGEGEGEGEGERQGREGLASCRSGAGAISETPSTQHASVIVPGESMPLVRGDVLTSQTVKCA
jgi:hypothetical protein